MLATCWVYFLLTLYLCLASEGQRLLQRYLSTWSDISRFHPFRGLLKMSPQNAVSPPPEIPYSTHYRPQLIISIESIIQISASEPLQKEGCKQTPTRIKNGALIGFRSSTSWIGSFLLRKTCHIHFILFQNVVPRIRAGTFEKKKLNGRCKGSMHWKKCRKEKRKKYETKLKYRWLQLRPVSCRCNKTQTFVFYCVCIQCECCAIWWHRRDSLRGLRT